MAKKSSFGHWKAATWTLSIKFAESRLKQAGSKLKPNFLLLSTLNPLKRTKSRLSKMTSFFKSCLRELGSKLRVNFPLLST